MRRLHRTAIQRQVLSPPGPNRRYEETNPAYFAGFVAGSSWVLAHPNGFAQELDSVDNCNLRLPYFGPTYDHRVNSNVDIARCKGWSPAAYWLEYAPAGSTYHQCKIAGTSILCTLDGQDVYFAVCVASQAGKAMMW